MPIADSGAVALAVTATDRLPGVYAWSTEDGIHWDRRPVSGPTRSLECLTSDSDRFLGIDDDSPLMGSADGARWDTIGAVPFLDSAPDTACVRPTTNGYVQLGEVDAPLGEGPTFASVVSTDGVTWSSPSTVPGFEAETLSISVVGDLILVPGYQHGSDLPEPRPARIQSVDGGITWTAATDWPDAVAAAAMDGHVIVAVGDGAWVAPVPGLTSSPAPSASMAP